MKLTYNIKDKPKFGQMIVFAVQQLLAIMAATIAVPAIVGNGMQQTAAMFGAGVGTLVYVLFTKANSPVFLGSSFAFIGSMSAAFAGAVSTSAGYAGLIIGAVFAGLVYVAIALIVKFAGVGWIDKLMPKQVIGPTVAIIGLGLAGSAISNLNAGGYTTAEGVSTAYPLLAVFCGLFGLLVTMLCSVYGNKNIKLIPFIIGIVAGYAMCALFTVIGIATGNDGLKLINFSHFQGIGLFALPKFTFLEAMKGVSEINGAYIGTVALAYMPVAFVVFAEHIADHKNISSIIETDLLKEPGLHRTLLGDGIGSMAGAVFGGCPNTTYGESVACVAISGNASVATIITTAILAIFIAFVSPFVAFVESIPSCVMGGVCMALYGFIAVSGLKMIQKVDLEDNRNLFTVSTILIAGIGGLVLDFGKIQITAVATALILGILVNLILHAGDKKKKA
ncbi:uracil-xanthine permease family protein [Neglectibacter caecimuris]|uniref:uracil-xanthine permease family protein n=1 Tax=Neglectibacter caecimuris TaxID=3093658 RepID=UPI002AC94871|nr:solute carrier family 23 protein [Neglectibacter sp. M00184]